MMSHDLSIACDLAINKFLVSARAICGFDVARAVVFFNGRVATLCDFYVVFLQSHVGVGLK
eukprot:3506206-Alexandrium_andersonii.AAC.1